jgi:predicted nucleic acid-binding protein
MSRLILLDTGPLGLVTNPRDSDKARRCKVWFRSMMSGTSDVLVPEIADFEVRRELVRSGKTEGIRRLDALTDQIGYLPVTTDVWRRAAALWAQARNEGYQTAKDAALDGDVLLAAQAQLAAESGHDVIVATDNVRHLGRFIVAELWEKIAL